jgi:hypothetical protein
MNCIEIVTLTIVLGIVIVGTVLCIQGIGILDTVIANISIV